MGYINTWHNHLMTAQLPERVHVAPAEQLAQMFCDHVVGCARDTLRQKTLFRVALSGGSMIDMIAPLVAHIDAQWQIFLVDERCVSSKDAESTFGQYLRRYPHLQPFLAPPAYLEGLETDEAAKRYADIVGHLPMDLCLLGMGPDGHTASLFPPVTEMMLKETRTVIPVFDSPKPPSRRISLSLPFILESKRIFVLTTGAAKADILSKILLTHDDQHVPIGQIKGDHVHWFLDRSAAPLLPIKSAGGDAHRQ